MPAAPEDKLKPNRFFKIIELIPSEQRLPAVVFTILQSIFSVIAFSGNENIQLAVILAMVIISCVFFIGYFNTSSLKKPSNINIQILMIIGVIVLSGQYLRYNKPDSPGSGPHETPATIIIYNHEKNKATVTPANENLPPEIRGVFEQATRLYKKKSYAEALNLFREFVFLNKTLDDDYWTARYRLGICMQRLEKWERALEVYDSLIFDLTRDNSENALNNQILFNSYNQVAIIYDTFNKLEKSYQYLVKANEVQPDETKIHLNLLFSSAKNKKEDDAKKWFSQVSEKHTPESINKYMLKNEKKLLLSYPWFKDWYYS